MADERDMEPLHGPDFVLDVENFGPIAEARDIAFKPMTVFVGPSNTGKSYLALLLHSLMRGLETPPQFQRRRFRSGSEALVALWRETTALTRRLSGFGEIGVADEIGIDSFAPPTGALLRENIDNQLDKWSLSVTSMVCDYFDVADLSELAAHRHQKRATTDLTLRETSDFGNWELGWIAGAPKFDLETSGLSWRARRLAQVVDRIDDESELDQYVSHFLLHRFVAEIANKVATKSRSWYLLASRTGILMSHRALTNSILANAHRIGVDEENSGRIRFHKVVAEFLQAINEIDPHARWVSRRSRRNHLAQQSKIASLIEGEVLLGKIEVSRGEYGPPEFMFAPDSAGLNLPMERSSSMVTELAPIVAFLRSHIEKGDLLIIEEPEAHLHPSAQQRLAGVLAYMVRKGLRVLITTHSHYMVEAMGMFVNSSRVDPDKRADSMRLLGDEVDRELYLNEDEIGIYSFDSVDAEGTVVHPVPFDEGSLSFAPVGHSDALVDEFNRISRVMDARITVDELAEAT